MIGYARVREWRVAMDSKPYANTVAEQLKTFDSEFAKYQLAYRNAPLRKKMKLSPRSPLSKVNRNPPPSRMQLLRLLLESVTMSLP
jgi:hypothetical protein